MRPHSAVQAWLSLNPRSRPRALETIKETPSSQIYRLAGARPGDKAVIAKRGSSEKLAVERAVYTGLLPKLTVPRIECFGLADHGDGTSWIFLEDAAGEAYDRHISPHRIAAARWVATVHISTAMMTQPTELPAVSTDHHRRELHQARTAILAALAGAPHASEERRVLEPLVETFDKVEASWQDIDARCRFLRPTLVHGDFTPKNLRVRPSRNGTTLLAIDWGRAAWGVGAVDLGLVDLPAYASLVGRHWPDLTLDVARGATNAGKVFRWVAALRTIPLSGAGPGAGQRLQTLRELERGLSTALDQLHGRQTLLAGDSARW